MEAGCQVFSDAKSKNKMFSVSSRYCFIISFLGGRGIVFQQWNLSSEFLHMLYTSLRHFCNTCIFNGSWVPVKQTHVALRYDFAERNVTMYWLFITWQERVSAHKNWGDLCNCVRRAKYLPHRKKTKAPAPSVIRIPRVEILAVSAPVECCVHRLGSRLVW